MSLVYYCKRKYVSFILAPLSFGVWIRPCTNSNLIIDTSSWGCMDLQVVDYGQCRDCEEKTTLLVKQGFTCCTCTAIGVTGTDIGGPACITSTGRDRRLNGGVRFDDNQNDIMFCQAEKCHTYMYMYVPYPSHKTWYGYPATGLLIVWAHWLCARCTMC